MLITFDDKYRTLWMFPRNIRKIYPWKIAQICQILNQLDLNKSNWDQKTQNEFSKLLTQGKLKSQHDLKDAKSGGARTYISQLESLGIVYKSEGNLHFTLAGKSLIDFEEPLKVIQTQLLNYQYPSTYSNNRNVRIHPSIKVKPFILVLRLLRDPEISYLSKSELVFPIIYGHNSASFDIVKEKIRKYRSTPKNQADLISLIDNVREDLYTSKTKNNTVEERLDEILNIGNTMKNYLLSSVMIFEEGMPGEESVIKINHDYDDIINEGIKNGERFIPFIKESEIQFSRAYGSWNKKKDISFNEKRIQLSKGETTILTNFYEYIGFQPVIDSADEFVDYMVYKDGMQRKLVEDVIEPLLSKSLGFFESRYLELSKGGARTAREFELATVTIFNKSLNVSAVHTGNAYKKGVGGFSDILLDNNDLSECAIIDTKASSVYNLSSADYSKMISNYTRDYLQLPQVGNKKLGFILYISGDFKGKIEGKLLSLTKETSIPASAMNARTLLEIAKLKELKISDIWQTFKINKVLTVQDFKKNAKV